MLSGWGEAILGLKLEGNFQSDRPWADKLGFEEYRRRWLASSQPSEFLASVGASLGDPRTVAELVQRGDDLVGFLWMTFNDLAAFDLTVAELADIALVGDERGQGIGRALLVRAAELAASRGASVVRGDTGWENMAARRAAEAAGARPVRVVYQVDLAP